MGIAVIALVAWAAASAGQAGGEPDDVLNASLAAAIRSCPELTIFDHVTGRAEGGVVILEGSVTSERKKTGIERHVRAAGRVHAVRNGITVLPASSADDEIRYRVARTIYGHPSFWTHAARPNPPIHIIVRDGTVTLTGVVESEVERAMAGALAGRGGRPVINRLAVEAGIRRRMGARPGS